MTPEEEFKDGTPEQFLEVAEGIVGMPISAELANWGAGMALIFQEVMSTDCKCGPCEQVRGMITTMLATGWTMLCR